MTPFIGFAQIDGNGQKAGTQVGYSYNPEDQKITGYLIYLPKDYYDDPNKKFPVVVFFHGAGEHGTNLETLKRTGPPMLVNQGKHFPFILISPQARYTWDNNIERADVLLEIIRKNLRIDDSRFYITGLSNGGAAAWNYTTTYPHKVAATVPICGWGNPGKICAMKDIPVWAFHNQGDNVVSVNSTIATVNALEKCQGDPMPLETIYPDAGHDAWTKTYKNQDVWDWLLSQRKNGTTPIPNQEPVANAGGDKSLTLPNNSISLFGSGTDSDGTIVSYQWTKVSGPGVILADIDKPTLKLTKLLEGTYVFKLTVTDNKGATASSLAKITVSPEPEPENQSPVANAGGDKTLTLPDNKITLYGSGSDNDGTIISYSWSKVSGPAATIADSDKANLKLSDLLEGSYTFKLTVTDDQGATSSSQVIVVVNPEPQNQIPVANAGDDKSLTLPENSITLVGSGTDNDGTITSYSWTKISGPNATMVDTDKASLKLSDLLEGSYTFRLTVTDNRGASAFSEVTVIVNSEPEPENQAPIANAGEDQVLNLPENSITLLGSGVDSDGSIITYKWLKVSGPDITIAEDDKASLELNNLSAGVYIFQLTVTDDRGATGSSKVKVSVFPEPIMENQAPIANAGEDQSLELPDHSITLEGSGFDNDGVIVLFNWIKVSGPDVMMSDTDMASLKLNNMVEGTYVFRLTVTDDKGATSSDKVTIYVNPEPENKVPTANAGKDMTLILPENSIILKGSGRDTDGSISSYHWTKVSGPNVTMEDSNKASLKLSGLVEGTYSFRLTVMDNKGATASDEVELIIHPAPNVLPIANAGSHKTITLPTNAVDLIGSGEDTDGEIVSYNWTKRSGPEATMSDTNKPTLKLNNLVEGIYIFKLDVKDNKGAIASDEVKVTVDPAPNQPPVANAGKDKLLHLPNNSIEIEGVGTDVDGTIISYQWSKLAGPSVSIANAFTSTLSLSDLVAGVYTFKLTVIDDKGAKASDEMTFVVNTPPVANAGRDKSLTLPQNSTYLSGAGSDIDGTIVAYSWTKKSGPSAVMKNADTYLLLLNELKEGTYVFTLEVTDNRGAKAWDDVKLTVLSAPNLPPTVNAGKDRKIQLPANSLQLVGSASDPDGQIASYLWEKISGPRTTMTGSEEPTLKLSDLVEGTYHFRLTVRDDKGASASDEVKVVVERIISEMKLAFVTTHNKCYGANEGEAFVTVTGGEMPYTYYWSNGETSEAIANLGAGNYTLTVTDKTGRSAKGAITISQPEELRVAVEIANETNRGHDGKISAKVSGGTAPYTYEWSNGDTKSKNENLIMGQYTLIVYDANGCSATQSYQVDKVKDYKTSIYPNPSDGRFNLSFDNLEASSYELKVFDSHGILVYERNNDITAVLQTEVIDLSDKGKGIYFIKIVYDNKHEETKRVIIH